MKSDTALACLSALGHETRLAAFRLLVTASCRLQQKCDLRAVF